ncbi:ANR family transcriptional regulator [Bibersteinia trehalosi]|nr:ANR family transcriptional regulator [Bibersteinia trehalosi]
MKTEEIAEAAARAERFGNYTQAADLWNKAAKATVNAKQQEWCKNRSDFCDRVAERPFKGER